MAMIVVLVVKAAFGDYEVGDVIRDPEEVEEVQASHPSYVIRTMEEEA